MAHQNLHLQDDITEGHTHGKQVRVSVALLGTLAGFVLLINSLIAQKFIYGAGSFNGELLAMIGALIGWKGILFTIFIGSAAGTFTGFISMVITRSMNMKLRIPFGPFLAIGAISYIFFGPLITLWYLNL